MNKLLASGRGAALPLAILLLVVVMVVPIPAFLLDVFFIANIAISLAVLMVALNAQKPLDFSAFPTVLLFATLFRLGLNVASTRVVLLEGHTGAGAAGAVIESFGHFLIGGNFAVGLIVFAILVVINFIVVTKGAERIAEVGARFTLDAMPGKQMAIDADLNSGLIDEDEARRRRAEVSAEADFYGAMDGGSKFVKGDAIAGIVITVINLVGGFVIAELPTLIDRLLVLAEPVVRRLADLDERARFDIPVLGEWVARVVITMVVAPPRDPPEEFLRKVLLPVLG